MFSKNHFQSVSIVQRLILCLLAIQLVGCGCSKEKETTYSTPTPVSVSSKLPWYIKTYYSEPADNPTTAEGIKLGEMLFNEKALSADNTISCAVCHDPKKAFADGLVVSKGINGILAPRNAPGLLNVGLQRKLFWDGRDTSLEQQSLHPIQNPDEMNLSIAEAVRKLEQIPTYPDLFGKAFGDQKITGDRIAKAIAQFERSLMSFKTKYDRYLLDQYTPTAEEKLGIDLFFTHPDPFVGLSGLRGGNCGDCHLPQTLTGRPNGFESFHNTGLVSTGDADIGLQKITGLSTDFGKFKTPSLRNIALTAPYMHNGQFATLEDVLDHYNDEDLFNKPNVDILIQKGTNQKFGQSLMLTTTEKKAIIAFLHMLTDSTYIP